MPRKAGFVRSMVDTVFNRPRKTAVDVVGKYFETFTAYKPTFTSWQGGIYEAELTRSIIESGAEHASKLKPEVSGGAQAAAVRALCAYPNPWMNTPQFIKRIWTILQVNDTALIIPMFGADGETLTGYYPVLPSQCEAWDVEGELWLRLAFPTGETVYAEWSRVGVMTRHQYMSDLFGDGTNVLQPTLELMHAQAEAEKAAIEQGSAIRFIGKLSMNRNDEDQAKAREAFNAQLSTDNAGGIAVYDKLFDDVVQITPQSYTVDVAQMERIEKSAYRFFGTSENIVLNCADEDEYNAFYEGRIEPFAVQLGFVLTGMTYTANELSHGNGIMLSANRLEFASNQTKLSVSTAMFDRGIWDGNTVADVFQSPHYEGGDKRVIRGEYIDLSLISEHTAEQAAQAAEVNANVAAIDAAATADEEEGTEDAS